MHTNPWFWIIFNASVLCLLAIDLLAFQRKAHAPSSKEAAIWTLVWVTLSLGFNAVVWHWMGPAKGLEFLTGYLIEYSLSVDNIFVFALIFSYFAVPAAYQHRVLFWGILSALVLRGVMIGLGAAFIETFHWALYFFGAFLLFTGAKILFNRRKAVDIAHNSLLRLLRARLPVSENYHGAQFTIRQNGRRCSAHPDGGVTERCWLGNSRRNRFVLTRQTPASRDESAFSGKASSSAASYQLTMTTITHSLPPRLSTDLEALHKRMKDRSLTLGELQQALKGRGSAMLLVLLALPFCFIAIPGLSMPFGIAIGFIGACMVIGREPWLPGFILRRRLSTAWSNRLLTGAIRLARTFESFVRPRLAFLHAGPTMPRLIGLGIVIASLGLMLPLPIPFSNSIPAWAVVLLAVGMMERDGLCVLLGHLTAVATWVFIGLTSALAVGGLQKLLESFPL